MANDVAAVERRTLFKRFGGFLASSAVVVTVGALLTIGVIIVRTGLRSNCCNCQLKQLGIALLNYHSIYRTFPPAYVADADGKPMHSWRVLILPYLEEQEIYKAYRFEEPWDGPNNRQLAARMPSVYRCPEVSDERPNTNYVVVVGPQTAWPGSTPMPISAITDGTSKTISIVEVADSDINWLEPRDMTFDEAIRGVNPPGNGPKISSHHHGGANVGWLDAHVSFFDDHVPSATVRALLTAAGREPVGDPSASQ